MALKYLFFSKNYKKLPSGWELRPHTPVCDTFELGTRLLSMSPNLDILTFKHLLQTLPLQQNPSCVPNQAMASDLPFCDIVVP